VENREKVARLLAEGATFFLHTDAVLQLAT